jgi:hemerythrin
MSIFLWDKNFELGIDLFDEHHRRLVDLLNKTYDNFVSRASHETLEPILDELIDYATYHFAAEEHWMGLHGYPQLQLHRAEHERFCRMIVEIQSDYHKHKVNLSLEVLAFVRNWLQDHILKTDAEYGRWSAGMLHQ